MRKAVSTLLVAIILISVMTITATINHVEAVDGNESMVTLVKDINPGSISSNIAGFIVDESTSTLYFAATDEIHGSELWKSDGTASDTMMVKDINPGASDSLPYNLQGALMGQTLFFVANDGVHGSELWKTDGTEAGTTMVKDIWDIDDRGSSPTNFLQHGAMIYFLALNYSLGRDMLWKTDGTPSGTVPIVPTITEPDYSPARLILSQGSFLYFIGYDSTHGHELWRTDGTAIGTIMLKDIVPGANWEIQHKLFVKEFGSLVFTVDYLSVGTDTQLWITDGTPTGTQLLKHFQTVSGWHPVRVVNKIAGNLLFFAGDGVNGYELWKTDGTPTGTVIIKDVNPGSGDAVDFTVYSYTGTPDYQAKFGVSYVGANPPYYLQTDSSSNLYIIADDGTAGWDPTTGIWTSEEIWKTDGTSGGTVKVTNFGSGGPIGGPYNPTPIGETLYYFRRYDLWKIDKPGETAVLVFNFTIPNEIFSMGGLRLGPYRVFGNDLLIWRFRPDLNTADPMDGYWELWITDGTNSGTRLLFTTATETGLLLEVMSGILFFVGEARVQDPSESLGSELYKYPNEAPIASISGSYTGLEGSPILFDASASTDDHSIVSYEWDWNGDGTYDETTGTSLVEHTWYDDYSGSARLKVVDGYGLVGEATTAVNILNVPPIASIDSIEHPYSNIFVGDSVTFHGSFLDPGSNDTHSTTWNFGDGALASGVLTPTHVYATNGLFTVTLTVTDDDGGVGSNSITIKVMAVNETLSDLINTVKDLNIRAGLKNSLLGKLRDANRLLIKGNYVGTAGKLNDFINQVEAQMGKKLANELATYLIARAQEIVDHI